jgi:hypothetical protein
MGVLIPGAYYEVHCRDKGEEERVVFKLRHDDPLPIPRRQFRRINEQMALFFMAWKLIITVDGGRTWLEWDAERDLPGWKDYETSNYRFIQDVSFSGEGIGTMKILPIRWPNSLTLHSDDWGRTWKVAQVAQADPK